MPDPRGRKSLSEREREKNKNKKNKHQICCKGDTKDIIQAIKMKRKRQEERKKKFHQFFTALNVHFPTVWPLVN